MVVIVEEEVVDKTHCGQEEAAGSLGLAAAQFNERYKKGKIKTLIALHLCPENIINIFRKVDLEESA